MSTYQISKSALLSLKAEVLKKKDEINKAKLENRTRIVNKVRIGKLELKNKGIQEREKNDLTEEEQDLLKKSRSILEQKSKLYDKLSKGINNEELSKRLLVQFNEKAGHKPNETYDKYPESEEEPINDEEYNAENSDDEFVEYTDCLGRTRTCLKKDLDFIKEKDKNLRSSVNLDEKREKRENQERKDRDDRNDIEEKEEEVEVVSEDKEMLSSDMRRELQRQQWEMEEDELRKKGNIHYEDVLFSEARSHGVSYYGFSKNEEERAKQQESLNKLRRETEEQQKVSSDIRKKREKILAARVLAAKNRRRGRMGLPPLTAEDEEKPDETEEETQDDTPIEKQLSEEELKKQKKLEEKRKNHIRPWDIGKDGVEITKKHYEHTQEEWVDLQRKKRDKEFAPPRLYNSSEKSYDINDSEQTEKGSLYFSTTIKHGKYSKKGPLRKRKDYDREENISESSYNPIVDECEIEEEIRRPRDIRTNINHTEIPPPPTYDYYGPNKRRSTDKTKINMEESIMEGLKYFREKVEQN